MDTIFLWIWWENVGNLPWHAPAIPVISPAGHFLWSGKPDFETSDDVSGSRWIRTVHSISLQLHEFDRKLAPTKSANIYHVVTCFEHWHWAHPLKSAACQGHLRPPPTAWKNLLPIFNISYVGRIPICFLRVGKNVIPNTSTAAMSFQQRCVFEVKHPARWVGSESLITSVIWEAPPFLTDVEKDIQQLIQADYDRYLQKWFTGMRYIFPG